MLYLHKYNKFIKVYEENNDDLLKYVSKKEIDKIKDIIYKKFNVKVNLEDDIDTVNESVLLTGISIISLLPEIMKLIGDFSNFLKIKMGINLTNEDMKKIRLLNDGIYAYKKILNGKNGFYNGEFYDLKNCYKISNDIFNVDKESEFKKLKTDEDIRNFIKNEIKSIKNKLDENFGTSFSKWLNEKSEKLHKLFISPIKLFLNAVSKLSDKKSNLRNEEYRDKICNIIYSVIIMSIAGVGIIESLSHLNGVKEVSNLIIKGYESGHKLSDILKSTLTKINV